MNSTYNRNDYTSITTVRSFAAFCHWAALLICYGFMTYNALMRFQISWDALAYHIPAALRLYGLTTYQPNDYLLELLKALPPLPYIVSGGLTALTGRLTLVQSHNALMFLLVALMLKALYGRRLSLRWFLTGCLGVPLFVGHFTSGYTDLFSGALMLACFGVLGWLFSGREHRLWPHLLMAACVLGASLSKFQAWPLVAVVVVVYSGRMLQSAARGTIGRLRLCLCLLLVVAAASCWPLRNTIRFQNPTYPFRPPIIGALVNNYEASLDNESLNAQLPSYLRGMPRPYVFLTSLLELNRRFLDQPYRWSVDQGAEFGPASRHHRLGGFFPVTILILSAVFLLGTLRRTVPPVIAVAFTACVFVVAFCIPQNHELRYWMFLPLTLAFVGGLTFPLMKTEESVPGKVALCACAYFAVIMFGGIKLHGTGSVRRWAPLEAQQFWRAHRGRTDETYSICGRMPYTIFWAGPTFNKFRITECMAKPEGMAQPEGLAQPEGMAQPDPQQNQQPDDANSHGEEHGPALP